MAALVVLIAVIALGALYQQSGLRRDRRRFPPPGDLVDVGGHRLHVVSRGQGSPAVLFESAIAASSVSWAVVQEEIATFTRVCTYDRAGLAWSDAPSCPRTLDRILDELSQVVSHLRIAEPFVLVGHSFGSLIVRGYAARRPQEVSGIVLVDPPTEWLSLTPERMRLLRGGRLLARLGAALAHAGVVRACLALLTGGAPGAPRRFVHVFGPTAARTLHRMVGEVRKLPPDVYPVVQALWCQPKCFQAMGDYFQTLEREGSALAADAPASQIPVVVISSGSQPPAQIAAHQQLAAASAAGRHVVASNSAHWVQFDEPMLVVDVVRDLVESIRSQREAS